MVKRLVYNTFFFLVLLFAAGLAYRHLFKGRLIPVLIAAVFLLLYALASAAGAYGTRELKKYEQIQIARGILPEDHPKLLLYATLIPLPLHFCLFLAALIPITTWEVWFITVFPCIFLSLPPIRAVCDEYHFYTRKKRLFWLLQILTISAVTVSAQSLVQTFL